MRVPGGLEDRRGPWVPFTEVTDSCEPSHHMDAGERTKVPQK